MTPTECKWCGCGVRAYGPDTIFHCWTITHPRGEWTQSAECKLKNAEDRIQRALEKLKTAERYRVAPVSQTSVWYDRTPDGPLTDSAALDDVARILEGDDCNG